MNSKNEKIVYMKKVIHKSNKPAVKTNNNVIDSDKSNPLPSLEEMLAKIPEGGIELTDEDRLFLSSTVGREIIKD